MGGKKKYIDMFGSFTEPFNYDLHGMYDIGNNNVFTSIRILLKLKNTSITVL